MKEKAFLFGPFMGELSWEYFRFAPYAIYLKKRSPNNKLIVLTRSSRFDLYGKYADILIPLRIEDDDINKQNCFRLNGYSYEKIEVIEKVFKIKYKKQYKIKHFRPNSLPTKYNLRWQFPRNCMDYDFLPRRRNSILINKKISNRKFLVLDENCSCFSEKYSVVKISNFKKSIERHIDGINITYIGCLISLLKRSNLVVSTLKSDIGRLALLLKKPLIYPNRDIEYDRVLLLNPYKVPVIDCQSIEEGVRYYENNF